MNSRLHIKQAYSDFETNRIVEDFGERKRAEPQSRIYHVTAIFSSQWFHGDKWGGKTGAGLYNLIGHFAPDFISRFRGWWISGLRVYLPNFNRKSKIASQPICHVFVDDPDGDDPYPHIHAVCWVPAKLVEGFERWSGTALSHDQMQIDIRAADENGQHLENVVRYAAKYHINWLLNEAGYMLTASFPNQTARHRTSS